MRNRYSDCRRERTRKRPRLQTASAVLRSAAPAFARPNIWRNRPYPKRKYETTDGQRNSCAYCWHHPALFDHSHCEPRCRVSLVQARSYTGQSAVESVQADQRHFHKGNEIRDTLLSNTRRFVGKNALQARLSTRYGRMRRIANEQRRSRRSATLTLPKRRFGRAKSVIDFPVFMKRFGSGVRAARACESREDL